MIGASSLLENAQLKLFRLMVEFRMIFVFIYAIYFIVISSMIILINYKVIWGIFLSIIDALYAISGFVFTNRFSIEKGNWFIKSAYYYYTFYYFGCGFIVSTINIEILMAANYFFFGVFLIYINYQLKKSEEEETKEPKLNIDDILDDFINTDYQQIEC